MRFVLDALYLIALVATCPYWVYRAIRTGKYRRGLVDRLFGRMPAQSIAPCDSSPQSRIWVHAVSVGEVMAVGPLLRQLQAARPDARIILTSTTDAGFALAQQRHPCLTVCRSPLDFSWAVRHFLNSVSPDLIVLVELELWPNLLLEARRRRVPVAVVNARMSARSHRGYRRVRWCLGRALAAVQWWGAQTQEYADRIAGLLPNPASIQVTGSLKFDGALIERENHRTGGLRRLLAIEEQDVVIVAGSTQHPEEGVLLDWWMATAEEHPRLRLILAPRSPERFDAVADLIGQRGLSFVRRSRMAEAARCRIVLLDTIGELSAAWGLATLGYVGGSLVPGRGGQSMIEPAAFGVPVCFGPYTANFQSTVDNLLARRAAREVKNPAEVHEVLTEWVCDPQTACELGRRARAFVLSQQGATGRTLAGLQRLLQAA